MPDAFTAPQIAWRAAGQPAPQRLVSRAAGLGDLPLVEAVGPCTCCGARDPQGVATDVLLNATFSNHADFLRHGTRHFCRACAWLMGQPKTLHRAMIAAGDMLLFPLRADSVTSTERPLWRDALRAVAGMPSDTPMAGVMTTDPKGRLWPRMPAASVGRPGLYLHWPERDVSAPVRWDWATLWADMSLVEEALSLGFARQRVLTCLYGDHARTMRSPAEAARLEAALAPRRADPSLLVATLATPAPRKGAQSEEGVRA